MLDRSITIQLAGNKPRAKVIPAVGYGIFRPSGDLDIPFIDPEFLNCQNLCTDDIDPEKLQTFLHLTQSNREIDLRFSQALRSHNDGLITANWDIAFLSFWRVFEILAFGESTNYDMNAVVKRVCILLDANSTSKDFLNLCASRRNNLVHRGVFSNEGQSLVLTINVFSKLCLTKFEKLLQNYGTEQLIEKFFGLAGSSTEQLSEQREVIEKILRERKK